MQLTTLISGFRQFVAAHPELKKIALAEMIGASPSTLSMILSGARNPTASQALQMLNVIRGGSTRIVGLQENANLRHMNGDPDQRIELNYRNVAYLTKFAQRVDCTAFDNSGRVACEDADPSEDPANGSGDPTSRSNRKAGAGAPGTDEPSLANLLSQLDALYRKIGAILDAQSIPKAVPNKSGSTPRTSQTFSQRR